MAAPSTVAIKPVTTATVKTTNMTTTKTTEVMMTKARTDTHCYVMNKPGIVSEKWSSSQARRTSDA